MIISLKWIKRYLPELKASVEEIDKALTSVGLEVEGVENKGEAYDKLIVGKVLECAKHPEADKLSVTKLFDGKEELQVVCGAPNVAAGQTVVFAPVGASLPLPDGGSLKLKKAKIRGVESFGMICAEDEIGLGSSHDGILVLDDSLEAGTPIVDLGMYDTLFEINVTPNRPDALSHLGVALELAAYFGVERQLPKALEVETLPEELGVNLEVEEGSGCTRYVARVIKGVKIGPSPDFIKQSLEAVGIRSINNVVDITNYVLMEFGQPLHAFDLDKIKSKTVRVRVANNGEKLTTLDEEERELVQGDLIICDGVEPACVAGVMGGLETEVDDNTVNILLETAYFNPSIVRKQARRLGMSSDSSYRFERGIDPFMQEEVSAYSASLIAKYAGGKVVDACASYESESHPKEKQVVGLRYKRVGQILGFDPAKEEIEAKLNGIGLATVSKGEDSWEFSIPGARPDLTREVDLIEEVARLCGFDNVPTVYPRLTLSTNPLPAIEKVRHQVRNYFVAAGLNEGLSLRFVKKSDVETVFEGNSELLDAIELANPLSEEWAVLPTSHLPKMLRQISFNYRNQEREFRVFEINRAFYKQMEKASDKHPGVREIDKLSGALAGVWNASGALENPDLADVLYTKSILMGLFRILGVDVEFKRPDSKRPYFHPFKQLELWAQGELLGELGEVHPKLGEAFGVGMIPSFFELNFELLVKLSGQQKKFVPFSKFGEVKREISMILPERLDHAEIIEKVSKYKVKNLVDVRLKSIYQGENIPAGKKSVLYQFVYQHTEKTLTDDEVNKAQDKLAKLLGQEPEIEYR